MHHGIYFQFKPYYKKYSGERSYLGDFLDLTGPDDMIKQVKQILIFPYGIGNPVRLTSIQIISLIHQSVGEILVHPIGEPSALYEPKQRKKENPLLVFFRVAFSILLLFFGSALAILYFHSDVNMIEAHQLVYYLISGQKVEKPVLFSVSYSIGIGAGIAIFFEVFEKLKNSNNPGPLELEMYQAEKELKDYQRDREGKNET